MNKGYTSVEQSKHLLELGIAPETADMCYSSLRHEDDTIAWIEHLGVPSKYDIPCWSLAALLDILPNSIENFDDDRCYRNYGLNLFKAYRYCCGYSFGPSLSEENHRQLCCFGEDNSWLDAVYKVVCWAFENGYIEKE